MTEQRYRFGGPIPESVQRLKERRQFRASSLYARVKRTRRERFEEEQAAICRKHSCEGESCGQVPCRPAESHLSA